MIRKFIALALSLGLLINSQKVDAQVYIAPEIGLALNKTAVEIIEASPEFDHNASAHLSFNAGVGFQLALNKHLIIQSGIFYTRFRYTNTVSYHPENQNPNIIYNPASTLFTVHYACLPLSLSYYHNIGKGSKLFAGLGGYAATTIYGKIGKHAPYKADLRIGNGGGNDFKALDAGILGYLGYQSPFGLFVRLQYEHGLRDLSNDDYEHNRTSGLSLSVGYRWIVQAK